MNVAQPESLHPSSLSAGDDNSLSTAAERQPASPDARYLAHDARNWLTTLQVYCDLLRNSGAIASGYEPWMEELSSAVRRGHGLVASLLESLEQTQTQTEASANLSMEPEKVGPVSLHGHRILRKSQGDPYIGRIGEDSGVHGAPASMEVSASTDIATSVDTPASVDIGPALTRRLPLLQRLAGDDIEVEIDAPANTGKAMLSETALERILYNLVSNAIEAMPGGGRLRITARRGNRHIGTERRSGSLEKSAPTKTLFLRVTDTGKGIAPEFLPSIFEAGVSGKTKGKGLSGLHGYGLAIVRELAERAGGAVRVRSHPGRGSCFEVKLPRA